MLTGPTFEKMLNKTVWIEGVTPLMVADERGRPAGIQYPTTEGVLKGLEGETIIVHVEGDLEPSVFFPGQIRRIMPKPSELATGVRQIAMPKMRS